MNTGHVGPGAAARGRASRRLRRWAVLVPAARRSRWLREWQSELDAHFGPAGDWDRSTIGQVERRIRGVPIDALRLRIEDSRRRVGGMLSGWSLDPVRRAVRSWTRRPGLFMAGVGTLALGIASTAVLFAVADHVLVRPLGFPDEDRLVALQGRRTGDQAIGIGTVSYPEVRDVGSGASSLGSTAAITAWQPGIETGSGPPVVAPGGTVSWNYFDVLGVQPALGRSFRPSDEGEGRAPVAIVSHALWTRAFGADTSAVGRSVDMNGVSYEVIGVLPVGYRDPGLLTFDGVAPEIWRTPWIDPSAWPRSGRSWRGIGRLESGVDIAVAREEVEAVMRVLGQRFPEESLDQTIDVVDLRTPVVGPVRPGILALLVAVGFVLAIAVLNTAGLVLNRTLDRGADWRVRRALGAGTGHLFGDLLAEALVLAMAAGVAGVALAVIGVEGVRGLAASSLPGAGQLGLDLRVLGAVLAVVLGVSLGLGLLPLTRVTREQELGSGGVGMRGTLGGRDRLRRGLLIGQVAATVVLLIGAGLAARTLTHLHEVDLGLATEGALVADLHGLGMFDRSADEAEAVYRTIFARLAALDGVRAVGGVDIVPLADNRSCDGVTPLDRPPPDPGEGLCAEVRSTTPGLLEALGLSPVLGRALEWSDGPDAPGAMVVSRSAAELFWPGADAVGRSALVHGDTFTVVGVTEDVFARGPAAEPDRTLYLSAAQEPWNGLTRGLGVVVRGRAGALPAAGEVRAAIQAADPREPVRSIRTLEGLRDDRIAVFRLRGMVMRIFAALALILAAVGLAGAVGFSVRRRRREYGLRLALGARSGELVRHALSEAARWLGTGTLVGFAVALPSALAARSLLFGVQPWDPRVLLAVPLVIGCMGLLAAWLPARRTAAIDPMTSLRSD